MNTTAKLDAYYQLLEKTTDLQMAVLAEIKSTEAQTINQLKEALKSGYSTVTGRLADLERKGLIYKTDQRKNGQTVWEATRPEMVAEMAYFAQKQRYEAWKRQGEKYAEFMPAPISGYFRK